MKRLGFGLFTLLSGLGAIVACAGEGSEPSGGPYGPSADASSLPEGDGGRPVVDADVDLDGAARVLCSEDGWCAPVVPEPPPTFLDLWPVADTAFAVSPTGILQAEGDRWVYINDRYAFGYAIWASSADDVWVAGNLGSVIHGVRQNGAWSWTSEKVAGNAALVAIWGSGPDDVYAIPVESYVPGGDVFHRVSDAEGVRWESDFRDDVPPDIHNNNIRIITSITGSGPDDIWISGRRSLLCGYLAHKSRGTYSVIADCSSNCVVEQGCNVVERPPFYFDRLSYLRPIQVHAPGNNVAMMLRLADLVRFEHEDGQAFKASSITVEGAPPAKEPWLWGPSETNLFVAGRSQVCHNPAVAVDGGPFAISSIALNGAPLRADFKVRGTSASNVWAFGGRYAVHKTKP